MLACGASREFLWLGEKSEFEEAPLPPVVTPSGIAMSKDRRDQNNSNL